MEEELANDEPAAPVAPEGLAANADGEEDMAQGEAIELLHAECAEKFYVRNRQLTRYGEQLRQQCAEQVKGKARRAMLRNGMVCVVRSGDSWQRVVILSIGTIQCNVRMVDSGQTEQVYIEDMHKVSSTVAQCKAAVLRCSIYDAVSLRASLAGDSFLQIIDAVFQRSRSTPRMYRIDIKQEEPILYVDVLCEPQNSTSVVSLRNILVFHGVCRSIPPHFPTAERSRAVTFLGTILAEANVRDAVRLPMAPLPIGSVCNATFGYAYAPDDFYVQPVGWADSDVRNQESLLQYYQRGPPDMAVKMPHVGLLCAIRVPAHSMRDHPAWYRGRIKTMTTQEDRGGTCEVILVDSGRPVTVHKLNLFALAERFRTIPAKVIHCKLAYVAPVTGDRYSDEVETMFHARCTSEKQYKVQFVERERDHYSVIVRMLADPSRCLAKELVQQKGAVFVGPGQDLLLADETDGERSAGPVTMYGYPVLSIPDTVDGFTCRVIHYDEPFLLVVVPSSLGDDVTQRAHLERRMSSRDDLVPMAIVKQHDPCIAYDDELGLLRGYITEYDLGMQHATVLLVDRHSTEFLPLSALYQCPSEVRNVPLAYVTVRAPQYSFVTDADDEGRIKSIWLELFNKYQLDQFYAKILNRSEQMLEVELYTDETCETLFLSRMLADELLIRIPHQPSGPNEPAGDAEERNE